MRAKYVEQKDEFLQLYHLGMTDHAISRQMQIAQTTISKWRRKNQLQQNTRLGYKTIEANLDEFLNMYIQNYTDQEIADRFHITIHSVRNFRIKEGLAKNKL